MVGAGLSFDARSDFGFKQCGSSIANYSDNEMPAEGLQEYQEGPFRQENHFVHPPPADSNNSRPGQVTFKSRDIRGVPAPIFVPQHRIHRVNGVFQNDSRGFAQQGFPPQPLNSQQAQPSSLRNNAFRNNDSKRPPVSQFSSYRGQPNRFEFSRLGSDDGNAYELQPMTTDMFRRPRKGNYSLHHLYQYSLTHSIESYVTTPNQYRFSVEEFSSSPPDATSNTDPANRERGNTVESNQDSDKSFQNHSFSFELIPLEQAQRRQAERRASGQDEAGHLLNARDQALALARNVTFATAGSHAGSRLLTPSGVATPSNQGRVSRFVPRGFAQFSSPLAGPESSTNGKIFTDKLKIKAKKSFHHLKEKLN